MSILILGSQGTMGKRYNSILRKLGIKPILADLEYEQHLTTSNIDRVIIATPTQTHYRYIKFFAGRGMDILCEKPVCTSHAEICELQKTCEHVKFNVVCNWSYVFEHRLEPESNYIRYHNETSGRDGLVWDCVQLIYLAKNFSCELKTGVPWDIIINDKSVTPKMIEDSYFKMITDWILHPDRLWSMQDAVNQICKCETYMEYKKLC